MKTQPTLYPKTRWTSERIARLGFLIGQGWDAKKVASDPVIASSANNVHRQAQRFGLAFRERTGGPFHLPARPPPFTTPQPPAAASPARA